MAHHHHYPPSQLEGEIFEMPADSVAPKTEPLLQANPWPFYLDQDVRTEARVDKEEGAEKTKVVERPLANPWAYFGPEMTSDEEKDKEEDESGHEAAAGARVVEPSVGGLGIKIEELKMEEQGDSKAESENVEDPSLRPPPLHLSGHDKQGADEAPPHDVPPPVPTASPPPPPGTDYIAPLRLSRKQVPAFTVAPAFKPYLPPEETNNETIAPLKVKHQRASSEGPQGGSTALPYRPYRPPGYVTPPGSKSDHGVDVAVPAVMPVPRPASTSSTPAKAPPPPPPNAQDSLVTGPVAPQMAPPLKTPSPSASPNLSQQQPQQHQVIEPSGSTGAPLDGAAPHRLHSPSVTAGSQLPAAPAQAPPPPPAPAAAASPPPPAAAAPAPAPPILGPVPTVAVVVAVTEPSAAAASIAFHAPPPPVPQTTAPPLHHHSPSPSASSPALGPPSSPSPAHGYSLHSSPALGHQAYMSPHSAPTSSMPSPNMTTYPFQPIGQGQTHNLYPSSTPTPPAGSPGHPASMYYPPAQPYTPPPPTSSYDIPQRTYASSADIPPPQPPRPPQYQQPSPGAYQPQASPQSPLHFAFPDVQRPDTQPPYAQPSMYNLPYGPAVAPHQHQYPTQPTYAAPNSEGPSSPNPQDLYAAPPLPPRPATATGWGSQPQVLTGFTPHVVAYPPPPKRVFDPPPAAPAGPPRKSSGGMGMGSGKLFSSSSALKWIDKTGKGLENRLDSVLGSQGASKPPPQPPRPN
ncbi:hypothetical protein FP744_10002826 [Trichoderma asperellum]|nr:hypothetical protein LI328DRAFT_137326 [Trichoderma asperelloides]